MRLVSGGGQKPTALKMRLDWLRVNGSRLSRRLACLGFSIKHAFARAESIRGPGFSNVTGRNRNGVERSVGCGGSVARVGHIDRRINRARAALVSTDRCLSKSVTSTPVPRFRAFRHHSCQQRPGGQSAMRRRGQTHGTSTTITQANSTVLVSSPPGPAKGKSGAGESHSRKCVASLLSDAQFLKKTCMTATPWPHSQKANGI